MMGLTHLPLNRMATILSNNICKGIFVNENDKIPIQITLKFALSSPIDIKTALVQVMAWRRIGDKPLSETTLTWFTDAYMRHLLAWGWGGGWGGGGWGGGGGGRWVNMGISLQIQMSHWDAN